MEKQKVRKKHGGKGLIISAGGIIIGLQTEKTKFAWHRVREKALFPDQFV